MTIECKLYGLEAQVTVSSKLFTWDRFYIEWGRICKNKTSLLAILLGLFKKYHSLAEQRDVPGDTTCLHGNKPMKI